MLQLDINPDTQRPDTGLDILRQGPLCGGSKLTDSAVFGMWGNPVQWNTRTVMKLERGQNIE